ncbi:hypothetical protein L211DRAFT_842384 [Terfezia boudieri ATCC MYA-4762]|uniref:Uncharacterized protein n=1 Tax=Terfezia boudieri ATCC MYA-4762 TaxID=1051890 RepID=A0A3N4L9W0_9PEZI|nr:hypothetical protein L211DRAFT_842384 [Terfezia boudieri ATCC MYA-4762]
MKKKVYEQIVQYLENLQKRIRNFKEGNITHLVYAAISPIIRDSRRKTRCRSI